MPTSARGAEMEEGKQVIVNRYDWTTGKWIPVLEDAKDYEFDENGEDIKFLDEDSSATKGTT